MSPASVKHSSVDLWGNVKVPVLESLLPLANTEDRSAWIPVPPNASYSSLVGIPLGNVPQLSSSASMYAELATSYWTVSCAPLTTQPRFTELSDNAEWFGPPIDEFPGATSLFATGKATGTRRRLLYESRTGNCTEGAPGCVLHAECSYAASFVVVGVNTTATTSTVLRVRNDTETSSPALTPSDRAAFRENLSGDHLWFFAKFFTTAFNSPSPLSNLQYCLQDPDKPWSVAADNGTTPIDTSSIPSDAFALRLAQLMNSLWASLIMDYLVPVGRVAGDDLATYTDQVGNRTAEIAKGPATVRAGYRAVRCHAGWMAVVLAAAVVVFAVAAAGIGISAVTTVPELHMNASTMVRLIVVLVYQTSVAVDSVEAYVKTSPLFTSEKQSPATLPGTPLVR
ncbi:hypothetical protein SLS55_005416 [Diplodia seriata]|uniref:Uncharacterized protein n=1 Tax=Diplodia seriata TaxID=420778 RepID=A0ABR3CGC2_9PEZI